MSKTMLSRGREKINLFSTTRLTDSIFIGGEMIAHRGQYKEGHQGYWKGKKLSESHKQAVSDSLAGNKSYNWKGGKAISTQGYVLIKRNALDIRCYVLEHRIVLEKYLGRLLDRTERVHHINRIKTDNRLENLMLFANDSAHIRFENKKHVTPKEIIFDGRQISQPTIGG